ncbi:glycosyltransferase family 2 protein [Rhodomicrobium vannielii ATCC 17100]|nr:glycosyltransferase family 2 protein [Rhodomicrobium vannielii ATCC 17100]
MAAMFTGFDASSGQFVAFLDADDVWLPSFLEKHVCCHLSPDATAALSSTNLAMMEADCTSAENSSKSGSRRYLTPEGGVGDSGKERR